MRPIVKTLAAGTASTNSIALTQTPGAAGPLTLNGAAVTAGVATLNPATQVTLTSAGNDSATNFTIQGLDADGQAATEVLAGPNANTVSSINYWSSITSITAGASVGSAITAGNGGVAVTAWIPLDRSQAPFGVGIGVDVVTGNPNYTVEHTYDDVFDLTILADFWPNAILAGVTGKGETNYIVPNCGVRLKINSGSGSLKMRIIQGMQP